MTDIDKKSMYSDKDASLPQLPFSAQPLSISQQHQHAPSAPTAVFFSMPVATTNIPLASPVISVPSLPSAPSLPSVPSMPSIPSVPSASSVPPIPSARHISKTEAKAVKHALKAQAKQDKHDLKAQAKQDKHNLKAQAKQDKHNLKAQVKQDKLDLKKQNKDLQCSFMASPPASGSSNFGTSSGSEFTSELVQQASDLKHELSYQTKIAVDAVKLEFEKLEKGIQQRYNSSSIRSGSNGTNKQGQQLGHVYSSSLSSSPPITPSSQPSIPHQQHQSSSQPQSQQIQQYPHQSQVLDYKAQKRLNKQLYRDQKQQLRQQRRLEKSIARENRHSQGYGPPLPIRLIGLGPRIVGRVVGGVVSDITRIVNNSNGNEIMYDQNRPQISIAPAPLTQPVYPPPQPSYHHLHQQQPFQEHGSMQYYPAQLAAPSHMPSAPPPTSIPSAPSSPSVSSPSIPHAAYSQKEKEIEAPDSLIVYRMNGLTLSPTSSSTSMAPMPAPSAPLLASMSYQSETDSEPVAAEDDDSSAPPPYEATYTRT
ncbi:hypothetical protein FBU30_010765 [Linnemannia zychae]|nr:hypothetical protein FBU30_010765 [Linnemannia zychae]